MPQVRELTGCVPDSYEFKTPIRVFFYIIIVFCTGSCILIYKNGSTEEYDSTNLVIKKEYLAWKWFLGLLLTLIPFINIIGFPYVIYRGVVNITSKYTNVNELYTNTIKVRDRRYNSGYRNELVTKNRVVKLLKTDDELKFTKIKGIGYLVIALFYIPLGLYLYLNK